jgi:hypothetical protein
MKAETEETDGGGRRGGPPMEVMILDRADLEAGVPLAFYARAKAGSGGSPSGSIREDIFRAEAVAGWAGAPNCGCGRVLPPAFEQNGSATLSLGSPKGEMPVLRDKESVTLFSHVGYTTKVVCCASRNSF